MNSSTSFERNAWAKDDRDAVSPGMLAEVLEVAERIIQVPIVGAAVTGSVLRRGFTASDVDLIVLIESRFRQRLRFDVRSVTVDVFQETKRSVLAELEQPRRGALIRLLANCSVLFDSNEILAHAKVAATSLLLETPPARVYPSRFALEERLRDTWRRYLSAEETIKATLRIYATVALFELVIFNLNLWPDGIREEICALKLRDEELSSNIEQAIAGSDDSFERLVHLLIDFSRPIRRGPMVMVQGTSSLKSSDK